MLSRGDVAPLRVYNWAFAQSAYIRGTDHHLLLVLVHHAFYKANNPENAPVGQVLAGYSSLDVLAAWTGLSEKTVRRVLWDLQAKHGYIIRTPRPFDGEPGRTPRIIRLYWTGEDDATRSAYRAGKIPLPEAFTVSAQQLEAWDRRSHLKPVLNDRYQT